MWAPLLLCHTSPFCQAGKELSRIEGVKPSDVAATVEKLKSSAATRQSSKVRLKYERKEGGTKGDLVHACEQEEETKALHTRLRRLIK